MLLLCQGEQWDQVMFLHKPRQPSSRDTSKIETWLDCHFFHKINTYLQDLDYELINPWWHESQGHRSVLDCLPLTLIDTRLPHQMDAYASKSPSGWTQYVFPKIWLHNISIWVWLVWGVYCDCFVANQLCNNKTVLYWAFILKRITLIIH